MHFEIQRTLLLCSKKNLIIKNIPPDDISISNFIVALRCWSKILDSPEFAPGETWVRRAREEKVIDPPVSGAVAVEQFMYRQSRDSGEWALGENPENQHAA